MVRRVSHVIQVAALVVCVALLPCNLVQAASPCSIVDDAGQTITLPAPAKRIIPLYAALGENLVAMGLGDRIVGRTVSDDSLPATLPVIGTHMRPNLELVAGLQPDLVVMLEGREEAGLAAEAIAKAGIPVARFRIASFADLFSCIERLGALTDEAPAAQKLVLDMRQRLDAIKKSTAGLTRAPSVFFEVRYPNLLGAGGGSMLTDIISAAGGQNCLAGYSDRMVRLNEETLALMNPDVYLVQQGAMNKTPVPLDERPHFRALKAVQNRTVFMVDESRFSRPGPQSVDAAEELAGMFLQWQKRGE